MIKAIVGAGGKTSLIKQLTNEYREQGLKVFVTTSTHMMREEDTLITEDADIIINVLQEQGYVMAGSALGEKIVSLPYEVYRKVCEFADVVLVEADGSKHLPIKYPADHEPVIYDNVDEIVVVCGLHALGKKAKDVVHRVELAEAMVGIMPEQVITPKEVQKLVRKGYLEPLKEKYPDKKITVEPNLKKSLYERAIGQLLKEDQDVTLIEKEWFQPQPQLIVCGAGHVSKELVKMAASLDFKIKVIDDREEFASKERFPMADEVIVDSFEYLENYMEDDAFYIIVTREHKDDYTCVKKILNSSYRYLGMIGSRSKVKRTLANLEQDGVTKESLETIFAPIGLPIHAVTPAEIAVSILAEVIMEKNKQHVASVSRELLEATEKGVLCIIVEKTGSSPRGVGSMMLVTESKVYDSIGGGAVEFAVIEETKNCDHVMLKSYDLGSKDYKNLGMICGGTNKVLFIPV